MRIYINELVVVGSDKVEHIQKVITSYPWFAEMYEEIGEFRRHPEEAIRMFSDALKILDENTVRYMIDEMKQEIEEKDGTIDGLKGMVGELEGTVGELEGTVKEKDGKIEELEKIIKELQKELQKKVH